MKWGENANYRGNPCQGCTAVRLTKDADGKYIRCDMHCEIRDAWKAKQEADRARKVAKCEIADALRGLEHHRCTTKKRKYAW